MGEAKYTPRDWMMYYKGMAHVFAIFKKKKMMNTCLRISENYMTKAIQEMEAKEK